MPKRYSFEDSKILVESFNNFKLLSVSIINHRTNFEILCPNKHVFNRLLRDFRESPNCPFCQKENLWKSATPLEEIIKEVNLYNFKIIEWINKYRNNRSEFKLECPNGHNFITKVIYFCSLHSCPYCNKRVSPTFDFVKDKFKERNMILLAKDYKNNKTKMPYICIDHPDEIQYINWDRFCRNQGCKVCGYEKRSGKYNYNWKGGISALRDYLTRHILQWKFNSLKQYNYKCVISKKENKLEVHHLYPFHKILEITLQETDLPLYSEISLYSEDELKLLINKCLEIHFRYPLGVCLEKSLHKEFHKLYGKKSFTPENFQEFYYYKTKEHFVLSYCK